MADFEKVYSIRFNTRRAQAGLKRLDKIITSIDKNTDKVEKNLGAFLNKKLPAGARKSRKALDGLQKKLQSFNKSLGTFGNKMSMYVTAPLTLAAGAAVKFTNDFNKGMANVSTMLTGGQEQFDGLRQSVRDLAKETGKPLDDLTDGLYQVVSAFGEGEQNAGQLGAAVKMSVAGLSTTTEAINLLSAVTKAYGDTSEGAQTKVSDFSFQTVKLGQTTFPELAAAIGKVTPLAAALNTSQEELFGTFATLTGVTGNAAEVSTQIASIYSAMLKPTGALQSTVEKMGYSSASAMMKEIGFRNSLLKLNEAVGGNQDELAKLLKRKEALVGALALLGGQSDEYKRKLEEMTRASGSTEEAYRKQTEGANATGHSLERTKAKMIDLGITIGDKLLPMLDRLLDKIEPIIKSFEKMNSDDLDMALLFGGIALAIGPVIKAVHGLSAAFTVLLAHPVVGALAAIGITVLTVTTYFDELVRDVETFISKIDIMYRKVKVFQAGIFKKALNFVGIDTSGGDEYRAGLQRDLDAAKERKDMITGKSKMDAERRAREAELQRVLRVTTRAPRDSLNPQMAALAPAGAGGGGVNIGGTSIVVNAAGGDPEKTARAVGRKVRQENRKFAGQLNRASANAGPVEQ